jgi:hypothetical protein
VACRQHMARPDQHAGAEAAIRARDTADTAPGIGGVVVGSPVVGLNHLRGVAETAEPDVERVTRE